MHKKFEINRTKIKGGCQSGKRVVTHNSKSDLPLAVCFSQKRGQKKWLNSVSLMNLFMFFFDDRVLLARNTCTALENH